MYDFEFLSPHSVAEAVAMLRDHEESKLLAGGQTFIPVLKQRLSRPSHEIDLSGAGLAGISFQSDRIVIGAMTTHATVAAHAVIGERIPGISRLASWIGDRQVRNLGTIGGSLANGDPAADYPAAVLALNATVITNKRQIKGDEFFTGLYETALRPGELLTSVAFQVPKRAAYMKHKSPSSGFALVGVFVADFGDHTRVAVTGAGASAFRQPDMEKALSGKFAPESVANIRVKADRLNNDVHATPEFRAHLISVLARRAVEAALEL